MTSRDKQTCLVLFQFDFILSRVNLSIVSMWLKTIVISTKNPETGQKTSTDIYPKKTYRWPINTWNDAQHCSLFSSVQFSSVAQSCPTLCDPMNRSTPGLPVHHQLPEFTQTHGHWVSDAIQPSHPLSSPSPPVPNPSQHQSFFQWVSSSHEVAKVLEFQL